MGDVRYCCDLPEGMRAGAEAVLGKKAVDSLGNHYADLLRPSFSYGPKKKAYASCGVKRPHGTIMIP